MQEFAWLRLNQFHDMVEFVADRVDDRKIRLVACGCVRLAPQLLEDARVRSALETAEAFAEYRANKQQLKAARRTLVGIVEDTRAGVMRDTSQFPDDVFYLDVVGYFEREERSSLAESTLRQRADDSPLVRAARIVSALTMTSRFTPGALVSLAWMVERLGPAQCGVLRDVVGNPFRPVTFSADWRTDTAMSLARVMYETRDFSPMPILADALQDAGCEDADILDHCRGGTIHVRGCWVVEWLRGR